MCEVSRISLPKIGFSTIQACGFLVQKQWRKFIETPFNLEKATFDNTKLIRVPLNIREGVGIINFKLFNQTTTIYKRILIYLLTLFVCFFAYSALFKFCIILFLLKSGRFYNSENTRVWFSTRHVALQCFKRIKQTLQCKTLKGNLLFKLFQ